jgi:peptidoglycan/LPS O-acetylase OafA/YrhL
VLWSLLQGGVEVILSNYTNGNVTIGEVLELFTSPRAQFWFLYALFLVFIVSLFALYLFGQKVLPLLFLLSVLFYMFGPKVELVVPLKYLSGCLVFFLMGAVFQKVNLIRFNSNFIAALLLVISAIAQYLFHESGLTYNEKGGFLLFVSTISLIAVISLSERLSVLGFSILWYLGSASMAIYLMHILAGSGIRVLLNKLLGIDSTAFHLIAGTAFGIILPLLALEFIKYYKIPYIFSFPLSRLLVRP